MVATDAGPVRVPSARQAPSEQSYTPRAAVPGAESHVMRRRLFDMLDAGIQNPLTLVSAPAGAGKTVLISSWLATGPAVVPAGRVRDEPGFDAATVWPSLVGILSGAGVEVPVPDIAGSGRWDRAAVAALGAACGESPHPIVVILETEAFASPGAGSDLDLLLRYAGGQLRIVLATRADPVAPLHRYRLTESMCEIRMADLAFTTTEAGALLAKAGVELSPGAMEQITRRTRGWAAGLRFAALFLTSRTDPERAVADFTGDSGTVAEYLLAEVLNSQSADVRRLLLRTSIVDTLRPGLVEVLAGTEGHRALALLSRLNAFVEELPGRPGDYAYHPLFRELLRAELGYESPSSVFTLHMVASDWLVGQGLVAEGVQHAVAAGAWDRGAAIIVDELMIGEVLRPPAAAPVGPVAAAAAAVPPDVPGAPSALVRAACGLARGDLAACRRDLTSAAAALARSGDGSWATDLTLLVVGLELAAASSDLARGRADAAAALSLMNQQARTVASRPALAQVVHRAHGDLLLEAGELEGALLAYAAGTRPHDDMRSPVLAAECCGAMALVLARQGRGREAVTTADRTLALARTAGAGESRAAGDAHIALAWVRMEEYELASARRHLGRAEECRPASRTAEAMLIVIRARLLRAGGDVEGALESVWRGLSGADRALPGSWDLLALERSSLELVAGHPEDAVQAVTDVRSAPEKALLLAQVRQSRGEEPDLATMALRGTSSPRPVRVGAWLLEASRLLTAGREVEASRSLESALRLAGPEHLRRPVREAPPSVRGLLRRQSGVSQRHGWLRMSGTTATRDEPDAEPAVTASEGRLLVEPLTEKEVQVLRHLADLLTTQEIAGAMFLSVNTIRTHVRNILRKLAASRRNEAIRRARELRII